ncbi:MAG: hypothetical protein AAFV33_10900 [Chloroflexota bacterium]
MYSARFTHHYRNAIREVMGESGMQAVFNLAGYPLNTPPDTLTLEQFAALNVGFLEMFGRVGGSGLAYRVGQAAITHHIRAGEMTVDGDTIATILPQLLEPLTAFANETVADIRPGDGYTDVVMLTCPACYDLTEKDVPLRTGKPSDLPVCRGIEGWLSEGVRYAMGGTEYPVKEMACRVTQGAAHCIFRITPPSPE